uniref:Uncharacterized protein n=1 Tax=Eunotia naegelii TaxID=1458866 RepID=A0A2U9GHZ4_9STRA|nr:hypothetical protein [Eunotia naegelii]AWQ64096.1 hypothetical protein [Eunotia naegelii]
MGNGNNEIDYFNIIIRIIILSIMVYYLRPQDLFKDPSHPDDQFNSFHHERLEYQKYLENGGTENFDTFLKKFRNDYQKKYFKNLFDPNNKKEEENSDENYSSDEESEE